MKRFNFGFTLRHALAFILGLASTTSFMVAAATQAQAVENPHASIVSSEPLPSDLENHVYSKPSQAPVISAADVMSPNYYDAKGETPVGRKVDAMRNELLNLQSRVAKLAEILSNVENSGQNQSAAYYASVATIDTQLQSGTTPGNPRLLQKLQTARQALDQFGSNMQTLNDVSLQITSASSHASYLLETVRVTYSLSGAIEEDHVRLAQMEDSINNTNVVIERLLNNVNDDLTRTTAYLNTERDNLRTLALAIESGNMFGKSLSNLSSRPFSTAPQTSFMPRPTSGIGSGMGQMSGQIPGMPSGNMDSGNTMTPMPGAPTASAAPSSPRPLVKIRFDRPDVDYQQPLYMAVNEALRRYPDARFELIAVHPSRGNAAEVAIESTKARRDAEQVLRSLTQMGLGLDRIDLSYNPSAEATTSEVHLYIR